jgi:hypothetical protein
VKARLASTLVLLGSLMASQPAFADSKDMTVWKSPWCGCCEAWSEAMQAAGYTVRIENREDLAPIKAKAGVPADMEGCHTAMIDGYFLEGHVPLSSVQRLLSERPAIAGLAVPGMPSGSLGMGEDPAARYHVHYVNGNGGTGIFEQVGAR